MPIKQLFLLLCCSCFTFVAVAQQTTKPPPTNKFKVLVLPVLFRTPDTKWGGGAGALSTFNFKQDSLGARRSSITFGAVYTQLRQVLLYAPFQLFPNNQRYWVNGEVGYYRYAFNYFGVGNDIPVDYIEKYNATFPRLRLNIGRKIRPGMYIGLRYAFDDFTFTKVEPNGLLAKNETTGSMGGRVSGAGVQWNFDSRDVLFFPTKGWVAEAFVYGEGAGTGSDFRYQRLSVDASRYLPIGRKCVLALNAAVVLSNGDVPFHQMPVLGGTKRLRGYFEGKYRDANLLLLQSEFRFPLFWRFGAVVFSGIGEVSDQPGNWNTRHIRYNLGSGVRFTLDQAQHINIRADYGIGYRSSGFYLTFGEAF